MFEAQVPQLLEGIARWTEGDAGGEEDLRAFAEHHADAHCRNRSDIASVLEDYAKLRCQLVALVFAELHPVEAAELVALQAAVDRTCEISVARFDLEQQQLQERFVSVLIHDLRDPLTAVMMAASLLAEMRLDERESQLVARVARGGRRIERMIDEVVDVALDRNGNGLAIAPVACDLTDACRRAIGELRTPARNIELETSGELAGTWDGDRVCQAVAVLLRNAMQSSPGIIVVRAVESDDRAEVRVSVIDHGAPTPADTLARMFDPVAQSLSDRLRGMPLGLYLVERIAQAHGGTVHATSSAANGNTITIVLPRST